MASRQKKPYARPTAPRAAVPDGQWLHDKAPTGPSKGRIPANRGAPNAPTGPSAAMNSTLLVSNLHYEITPKDLISIFGQIGTLVREPLLRYDRSGRSIGEAVIAFESPAEATRAKKQFSGILAKGQPMSISYHIAPKAPRRSASAPITTSLLNRIEKPPLAERLSRDDSSVNPPSGPRNLTGPVRNRPSRGGGGNSKPAGASGSTSTSAAAHAPKASKASKKPKTAEELDKELDAFMGDAETVGVAVAAAGAGTVATEGAVGLGAGGDVDMA